MSTARLKRSLRITLLGLGANAVLAATKLLAGIFGHSHALVADAVESLADVFSSIVVWRGVVVADEPPDEEHPYGHGKAEPLATAVVSVMLLVAAVWIVIRALSAIAEPHPAPKPFTLIVLIAVIIIKELLFRFALHEAISVDNSTVAADAWHHRSDAITSFAAAIGITIALVGGKGFEAADDWAAVAAACVIALNGWRLLRPAMNELMDRSPNRDVVDRICKVAESVPGVARVEKCLARKMGYQYLVDMHVEVDPQMTVLRSHEIAHLVKDKIRDEIPRVRDVLIHIEPRGQKTGRPDDKPGAAGAFTNS
jgi:cation diffusion facilitator family transporter